MLSWWMLTPMLTFMLVALILPGALWLRAGMRSSLVAVGAAPAFTFGIITLLCVLYPLAGIAWEPSTVLPVLGLGAVGGTLAWAGAYFRRINGDFSLRGRSIRDAIGVRTPIGPAQRAVRAATWGAILFGFLLAAFPLISLANPDNPPQQWDSTFHLNGVHALLYGKDASPFGGLHELYGGRRVYYPTGWHAFVALFSTPDTVVRAANVSSLALMLVWVCGLAALVSVVTTSRSALIAAPLIGGCLLNMPADALTMYNQWPNASGTAIVPGLAACMVIVGRRARADLEAGKGWYSFTARLPQFLFLLVGCLGLVGAHPSAAFSLIVLLAAPLLAVLLRLTREALKSEGSAHLAAVGWAFAALAVVVIPLLALASPRIRAMGRYPRHGVSWGEAFSHAFLPYPPFSQTSGMGGWTFVQFILLIAGIVVITGLTRFLRRLPREDGSASSLDDLPVWPLVSYLLLAALTALAYAPDSQVRTFLLAPWYMDARRIMGVEGIALTVLLSLGCAFLAHALRALLVRALAPIDEASPLRALARTWVPTLLVALIVLLISQGGALDARSRAVTYVYDPNRLGRPGMATSGELEMLRRMPSTLPADALVVGDPIAGAAYTEVIGNRKAVFPQLSAVNADAQSQAVLVQHFKDIHTDPSVCETVRRLGITHFYEEEDGQYYNFARSSRFPGLYGVDTSSGFELVDQGDTAKLWRITACGDVTGGGGAQAFR